MRKLLVKILLRFTVGDLRNSESSQHKRERGYRVLHDNVDMMQNLQKILIEDTKEMMKRDWKTDESRWMRVGAFIRTKAIYDKAIELYEKGQK